MWHISQPTAMFKNGLTGKVNYGAWSNQRQVIIRLHFMHGVQRCGRKDAASYRCSVVCLSVGHSSEPHKNRWTDRDAILVVDSGRPRESWIRLGPRYPRGKGQFWALFPHWNALVCKQQMPQQHRAAPCPSHQKCGFRMDWLSMEVLSAGLMQPFVKILWPLVIVYKIFSVWVLVHFSAWC